MTLETPCIQVCVIDEHHRLCRGCGRTLDEIAAWSRYSSARRQQIMRELPARLLPLTTSTKPRGAS